MINLNKESYTSYSVLALAGLYVSVQS